MTKRTSSTALALAVSLPLSAMFAAPAHAEDTGLIRHLNAQTRAQVQDHNARIHSKNGYSNGVSAQEKADIEKAKNQLGAGIRG